MSYQFEGSHYVFGIFCNFAFHFKQDFSLDSFLCVFCQFFEISHFLRFQTFNGGR